MKKKIAIFLVVITLFISFAFSGCKNKDETETLNADNLSETTNANANGTAVSSDVSENANNGTTQAPEKILIAEKINNGSLSVRKLGSLEVEDLIFYMKDKLTFKDREPNTSKRTISYGFKGSGSAAKGIKAYVKMLTENGFKTVNTYEETIESTFYACALNYAAKNIDGKADMYFGDGGLGNVVVFYKIEDGELEGNVTYSQLLKLVDSGVRYGSNTVNTVYTGESANAGLYKQGNSYETTDGRLKTSLGSAAIICDGKNYSVKTEASVSDKGVATLASKNFNGENSFGIILSEGKMQSPGTYAIDLLNNNEAVYSLLHDYSHANMIDAMNAIKWTFGLGFCHNGEYTCPSPIVSTGVKNAFLRVLYYEENAVVVCYAAVEFDSAPYKAEMLAAFSLSPSGNSSGSGGNSGSGSNSGSPGVAKANNLCMYCGNRGYRDCSKCIDGEITCYACNGARDYDLQNRSYHKCSVCNDYGKVKCRDCDHGKVDCPYCSIWR